MKKLSLLMAIMVTIQHTSLHLSTSVTARVAPKSALNFMWRGQKTQYLPPEKYSAFSKSLQDFKTLYKKSEPLSKQYIAFDTNPVYEKVVKPYKALKSQQHQQLEALNHQKLSAQQLYRKNSTDPKLTIEEQTDLSKKEIEGITQNFDNIQARVVHPISDLDEKLEIIDKIFKFHTSFQVWKKSQPVEITQRIDPIVLQYNESYHRFRQQPLNPVLIKLVYDQQQQLSQLISEITASTQQKDGSNFQYRVERHSEQNDEHEEIQRLKKELAGLTR